jgi:short-subunit dehydrogenase
VVDTSAEEMLQIFRTNLFGTTDCIRFAVPVMMQQEICEGYRGQIMIVSSGAARRGLPFFGPYSATKAAQLSIAEALRVEVHPNNIAVTSVHPIGTATEFFDVAEQQGGTGRKLPPRKAVDVVQTPQKVAKKMVRAIERPKREVWPMPPARWLLSLATLMPGVADRIMIRARGKIL